MYISTIIAGAADRPDSSPSAAYLQLADTNKLQESPGIDSWVCIHDEDSHCVGCGSRPIWGDCFECTMKDCDNAQLCKACFHLHSSGTKLMGGGTMFCTQPELPPAQLNLSLSNITFSSESRGHPGSNVLDSDSASYWETNRSRALGPSGHSMSITLPQSHSKGYVSELSVYLDSSWGSYCPQKVELYGEDSQRI